jgi:phosphatidylserine/phosphatidylglycerophosphate/cardiolipin synthase-like enzyme
MYDEKLFGKGFETINKDTIIEEKRINETTYLEYTKPIEIKTLFCPEDKCVKNIANEIINAKKSIKFMVFSFTDETIAEIIITQSKKIEVTGIVEKAQSNVQGSKFQYLKNNKVNVSLDNNKYYMHHKVFIIDDETVITGSMNPTNSGNLRNDENIIIIKDERIAKKYLEEFDRINK